MHNVTQDIIDLVLWFEKRGYTRDKVLQTFDEVVWFIDNNSKINVKNNYRQNISDNISRSFKRKGISLLASIDDTV